jgi:outer membrane protein assembly factor BamB
VKRALRSKLAIGLALGVLLLGGVAGFLEWQARYGALPVISFASEAGGKVVVLDELRATRQGRGSGQLRRLVSIDVTNGHVVGRTKIGDGSLLTVTNGKIYWVSDEGLVVRDAKTLEVVANAADTRTRTGALTPGASPCVVTPNGPIRATATDGRFIQIALPELTVSPAESPLCPAPAESGSKLRYSEPVTLVPAEGRTGSVIAIGEAEKKRTTATAFVDALLLAPSTPGSVLVAHQRVAGRDRFPTLTAVALDSARELWNAQLPWTGGTPSRAALATADVLLVLSEDRVAALDARTGAVKWTRGVLP